MHRLPIATCLAVLLAACTTSPRKDVRRDALTPVRDEFDAADSDGNGALSRDETAAGMPDLAPLFDSIDTDGNAEISAAELRSYLEWRRILAQPPHGARDRLR